MSLEHVLPKSSWFLRDYRAMIAAQGRLSADDVRNRERDYRTWWEDKFAMIWRDRVETQVTHELPREPILKPVKVIGHIDGRPVTVRAVTFAGTCKQFETTITESVYEYKAATQPPLYVVAWAGKRIDSFLKAANAKARALDFIKLNGGE